MSEEASEFAPLIVVVNMGFVALGLIVLGIVLTRKPLTSGVPGPKQNFGEFMLDFFVGKAREIGDTRIVRVVAPFLATFFFIILGANLFAVLPFPLINRPPTSYFGITIGLALAAVLGTFIMNMRVNGAGKAVKHLFWPNPMQLISEITDVLSLGLRLFGNIAGEYMTIVLVSSVVAFGIPLILHALGFIPAFVQALVFTLLTTSFIAGALGHHEEKAKKAKKSKGIQTEVRKGFIARLRSRGEQVATEPVKSTSEVSPSVEVLKEA